MEMLSRRRETYHKHNEKTVETVDEIQEVDPEVLSDHIDELVEQLDELEKDS